MQFFEKILDSGALLISGFFGAIVALAAHTEVRTLRQRLYFIGCGTGTAFFTADLVAQYFMLDSVRFVNAMGFLIGVFGAALIQAIIRSLKTLDIVEVIRNSIGNVLDKLTGRRG